MKDSTFVGSQFKVLLDIDSDGFNIDEDDWICVIKNGRRTIEADRNRNSVRHEDGKWFVLVDTDQLGSGQYEMVVDIDVPDTDFPSGLRHETYMINLIPVFPVFVPSFYKL